MRSSCIAGYLPRQGFHLSQSISWSSCVGHCGHSSPNLHKDWECFDTSDCTVFQKSSEQMQLQTDFRAIVARYSSLRQISFWSHTNYSLPESRMLGPCRRLFVLHCKSELCFLRFMSSLEQDEETLRHGSKMFKTSIFYLYLLSVSQRKKLEHCSVPSKFSMQFFSLQTCLIVSNPKEVLLCPSTSSWLNSINNKSLLKHSTFWSFRIGYAHSFDSLGWAWRLEICETTS